MTQYVYRFGGGVSDGGKGDKNLLGGKGANLAEMASIGLPVPPGFTISTDFCAVYYDEGGQFPQGLRDEVATGLAHIEGVTGKMFGDAADPLLVSVRSGARASMPGMMDTVLNLGLNDETVEGLAAKSEDARFAWDSYRRFIQMYADVVLELDHGAFEEALEIAKEDQGFTLDTELSADDLRALVTEYKGLVEKLWGKPFPQDVHDQLWGAVGAVFGSWQSERAKVYRRLNDIPASWGTAVNIQAMVFGNMGDTSATGVAFTRDPSKGDRAYYGEFLINAQGEDVVAGIRTPQYLTKVAREDAGAKAASMEEAMPEVYGQLAGVFDTLENHYRDMQDIEFTVEKTKLWMLQTRAGKRTAKAALKIAVDMANEGLITREEAILRVEPMALDQLLHPTLDPNAKRDVLTKGLPASPGAASGAVVFDADAAEKKAADGVAVILVRTETSPDDIHGMHAARGILTARGGMTSHAAVVARGMGRPCVSGAGTLSIDTKAKIMRCGGREVKEGDLLTIDGSTGEVMIGAVATVQPELSGDFGTLMTWADEVRRLKVRANAETPEDCRVAREFGAEGVGLCRTEHMFFESSRITNVRQMILASDEKGRRAALEKLLPEQRKDFTEILEVMAGLPVTIRLLDPPLHEFLPHEESEFAEVATAAGIDVDTLKRRAAELHEFNPMLGHRGCRLGVTYPEIYEMQARAIFEAAVDVAEKSGAAPIPEVMIPLVATRRELELMKAVVDKAAQAVFADKGRTIEYLVGTMIELPRAALRAGEIAEVGEFFSFGTNDLTQTTLGVSRDDAARFLGAYVEQGIYAKDPFVSIDVEGVGELIEIAAERGRKTRSGIKLGICGEHGGDPASIAFCEKVGLDYVSASPYRVPIARLAAAQAALNKQ
ncbi:MULTISPECIES: pyruvate, phosphate dikinase [Sphingomonas]|jgi:pyruvate,orthophosphate dikinase|uniref:Pyruvate, phosphate dikinase n=1 Tax=Sphingomonas aerolata TaxID=185951 RepID=A0A2T4YTH5_9SPHN|nr:MULTISPECIES: pyruvate, phosphate dikinase [Sphingomonas]KQM94695.1 pyruvate phosphate dikinase [Sphingomonas sp. Leaf226]MBD8640523.1 pyruvate, phosphate dikinase [Sphingomonas sp. CFBP 13733]MDY0968052.1 pyruvate, phosphate dikinase [Sphingomonas sp. CFBP9021]PTM47114.1 pyruvate phosphate dikinase [Sphingomonas aerolata]USR01221.1 pyruvate, phosphate dikinase [Sphingomonas aerolata]